MGKMLHNEARELLVESYEKTHNAEEIAKIFGEVNCLPLPKTVSCALLCVSQRDCVGWFKADGYCL